MFEESKKLGLKNRDELRSLSLNEQRSLQEMAAKKIYNMQGNILFIDTIFSLKPQRAFIQDFRCILLIF